MPRKGGVGERAEVVHNLEYGKRALKLGDFLNR